MIYNKQSNITFLLVNKKLCFLFTGHEGHKEEAADFRCGNDLFEILHDTFRRLLKFQIHHKYHQCA